jgi:predicted RNase H-like nuclease (RuvC/YqgF family)
VLKADISWSIQVKTTELDKRSKPEEPQVQASRHTSSGSWRQELHEGGDTPMTLQDVEEQINNLQAEIEGLKETIEEVTTGLYTLVGQLITR